MSHPSENDNLPLITIDIISDINCPYCYIGKKKLEKTINNLNSSYRFEVNWLPYELNQRLSNKGVDIRKSYVKKFGDERANNKLQQLKNITKTVGINMNENGILSNSFSGHRLLHYSKQFDKQNELSELLFYKNFVDGKNIGDLNVLIECANEINIPKAKEYLESDCDVLYLKKIINIHKNKVHSVPYFIINSTFGISGAQDERVFTNIFNKLSSNKISYFTKLSSKL
eukprot:TRINITY_DN16605_c0_g1_i1.p1 TRINITY_DN16605_c0_g1~~TRINITY_DN16605_c0_g1_i1.p1  ORF type:complete len:228 (+),score=11.98 TRINITY_DN16605_c0_g1_i1:139-822(+)